MLGLVWPKTNVREISRKLLFRRTLALSTLTLTLIPTVIASRVRICGWAIPGLPKSGQPMSMFSPLEMWRGDLVSPDPLRLGSDVH